MKCATLRPRGNGHRALVAAGLKTKRDRAAVEAGLSAPMVTWAPRIAHFGVPELVAAVENGKLALYTAARVSRWAPEAQKEFLAVTAGAESTLTARDLTEHFTSSNVSARGITLATTVSATANPNTGKHS